jgi:hypothetical protein
MALFAFRLIGAVVTVFGHYFAVDSIDDFLCCSSLVAGVANVTRYPVDCCCFYLDVVVDVRLSMIVVVNGFCFSC